MVLLFLSQSAAVSKLGLFFSINVKPDSSFVGSGDILLFRPRGVRGHQGHPTCKVSVSALRVTFPDLYRYLDT